MVGFSAQSYVSKERPLPLTTLRLQLSANLRPHTEEPKAKRAHAPKTLQVRRTDGAACLSGTSNPRAIWGAESETRGSLWACLSLYTRVSCWQSRYGRIWNGPRKVIFSGISREDNESGYSATPAICDFFWKWPCYVTYTFGCIKLRRSQIKRPQVMSLRIFGPQGHDFGYDFWAKNSVRNFFWDRPPL